MSRLSFVAEEQGIGEKGIKIHIGKTPMMKAEQGSMQGKYHDSEKPGSTNKKEGRHSGPYGNDS